GALYPTSTRTAPNPHATPEEGDTPSWSHFLPTGPGDPARPGWGGWGGRLRKERGGLYRDATDTVGGVTDARAAVWRWRPAFRADFAARALWCVRPAGGRTTRPRRSSTATGRPRRWAWGCGPGRRWSCRPPGRRTR